MKSVTGRAEARWLPSRHFFAIFRLAAFFRLATAPPERRDVLLAVDRHQSTPEVIVTGFWYFVTAACYFTALVPEWPLLFSLPVGFAVAVVLFQPVFILMALTIVRLGRKVARSDEDDNADVNSTLTLLLLGIISIRFFNDPSWLRLVAWQYFLGIVLNGSAAVLLFMLRNRIRALEATYEGGPPSVARS